MPQIELFLTSIVELENQRRGMALNDLAIASNAGFNGGESAKSLNKFVNDLVK